MVSKKPSSGKNSYNTKPSGSAYVPPPKRGFWRRVLTSAWTWRILFMIVVAVLLWWQWENVTSAGGNFIMGTYTLLGWGLIVIIFGVIVALSVLFRERLSSFAHSWTLNYWYRWLGGLILIFVIWGILGAISSGDGWLGGSVGRSIFGENTATGILKLSLLALLAFILLLPAVVWRMLRGAGRGFCSLFRRRPPRSRPETGTSASSVSRSTFVPAGTADESEHASRKKETRGLPFQPPLTPQSAKKAPEAHQKGTILGGAATPRPAAPAPGAAKDVWLKYGEADGVVMLDGWKLPPIDILDDTQDKEFGDSDNHQRARLIEDALASYGVNGKVVEINVGPTVTQFGIEPGWDIKTRRVQEKDSNGNVVTRDEEISRTRVKVERIAALGSNLALALSAPTIRIEAPVPGKPIVGLEVPNRVYTTVSMRSIIESSSFQKVLGKSKLALALGKGAGGETVSDDLAKMPHLLIAGATGSGKTVCLNAVICCLLMNNTPYEAKMIMIDPKRVELTPFNSLPHLAAPVIVDTDKALSTMRWLNMEMDNRYKKLATVQARNIDGYNKSRTGADRMPYLVLVIDELADLMMAGFDEVEHILCRLAQLARAVGIHLVVATQRPSVDVITGLIKANFPTRISFAVTSQVDSRTILDAVGAEKLLGRGDMLFAPPDAAKPKRLQGCYVSDPEVERLVYFWNSQKKQEVQPLNVTEIASAPPVTRKESPPADPMMDSVRQLAAEHNQISASFLQRKLGIGYPRAARLFELLQEEQKTNRDLGLDGGAEVPREKPGFNALDDEDD
ncbi:MAG: FtsK/SpoIIIE domain-containing protein [Dehalococcoidia bacterium]|nr:FtsK/SpoIIIE domain-containing protein [Dehalococcoidia bacterium]